jgi:hypothetical protein
MPENSILLFDITQHMFESNVKAARFQIKVANFFIFEMTVAQAIVLQAKSGHAAI